MSGAAIGSAEVLINGEYVLLGGTGTGSFDLNYDPYFLQGPGLSCSVVIDGGKAQSCSSPVMVEYGEAFIMGIELDVFAAGGQDGEGVEGEAFVDFSQQGLTLVNPHPAPEPSSILLLMPGLAGVMFAAKSRLRNR
jgi:hypothetical protein